MTKPNHNRVQWSLNAGFTFAMTILVINGVVSTWNIRKAAENNGLVVHSLEVISGLQALISTATDAETGQRGFLITGNDAYLQPLVAAVDKLSSITAHIKHLTAGIPEHETRITLADVFWRENRGAARDDRLRRQQDSPRPSRWYSRIRARRPWSAPRVVGEMETHERTCWTVASPTPPPVSGGRS